MKLFKIPIVLVFICLLAGCKEEYYPNINATEQSVLVVEGMLNAQGPTNVQLTRTYRLDGLPQLRPEANAQVTVEGTSGVVFPLHDLSGDGNYSSNGLQLDAAAQYKLHIRTVDGKEYESEPISLLKNPPVDSISWQLSDEGVRIYVSTHNPENNTRYYRWNYDETWEIESAYYAGYKVVNGVVLPRDASESVYTCWKYAFSSSIQLASSAKLQSDVIHRHPLLLVPRGAEKMAVRYSILVRQYALDKKGYEFYQLMKKNTESLGSIFDAQPSEITGNIRSTTDPAARVIGYITAGAIQEKRVFIDDLEIRRNWGYRLACNSRQMPNNPDSIRIYFPDQLLPYEAIRRGPGPGITAYNVSEPPCVDCTLRGGSTDRPSYW